MAREQAKFIWTDRDGAGYNRYAFFRRAFELEAPPQTGISTCSPTPATGSA